MIYLILIALGVSFVIYYKTIRKACLVRRFKQGLVDIKQDLTGCKAKDGSLTKDDTFADLDKKDT